MTTAFLDKKIHEFIIKNNAYPSILGYYDFPKSVGISVNEICCHGIPNMRKLENGDYINIDSTVYLNGVHGDTSLMI